MHSCQWRIRICFGTAALVFSVCHLEQSCIASDSKAVHEPNARKNLVTVYDGRFQKVKWDMRADLKPQLSAEERLCLSEKILPAAKEIWKEKELEADFKPLAVLSGSFTAKAAKQRLVLYQYCEQSSYGLYGLVVFQDGKQLSHFCFQGDVPARIVALPDIDKDGCSEVALESWSMHQGYRRAYIRLFSVGPEFVGKFGIFKIADDDLNSNTYFKYVIKAEAERKNPRFQSEKFQKMKNKWKLMSVAKNLKPGEDCDEFINPVLKIYGKR